MEEQRAPTIGKIATKYGLIQGVLSFVFFLIVAITGMRQGWVTTVISIAILVVVMVLAHQAYKKTHEGMMTYPQGLGSGTLLSIVSAVLTSILVFAYVTFINPGYRDAQLKVQQAMLAERGIT